MLVIKQMRCLRACLLEAAATGLLSPAAASPQPGAAAKRAAAGEAAGGGGSSGSATIGSSGRGSSLLGSLLTGGGSYDVDGPPSAANVAAASAFLDAVLTALPALARIKMQTVQEEAAK